MTREQESILGAVYALCDQLKGRQAIIARITNRELAKKYGVSLRTVVNWRKRGCPFANGQWRVLDWMFARRYLPVAAKRKFVRQFNRRRKRVRRCLREICSMLGEPVPDSLREIQR